MFVILGTTKGAYIDVMCGYAQQWWSRSYEEGHTLSGGVVESIMIYGDRDGGFRVISW